MYHVYVVNHVASGRNYVGMTSKRIPIQRWRDHQWDAEHGKQNCRMFHRAIRKYGASAFIFRVVEAVGTLREAYDRETWWIDHLHSTTAERGFNILRRYHHEMTEETREKLRLANTGKKHSAETKAKLSAYRAGRIMSQDTKDKIRKSMAGHVRSTESVERSAAAHRGKPRSPEYMAKIRSKSKLTEDLVIELRARRASGELLRCLAAAYGVSIATVSHIARRQSWA